MQKGFASWFQRTLGQGYGGGAIASMAKKKMMALGEYPDVTLLLKKPVIVTRQLAKSLMLASIRWRNAKLRPKTGCGKLKSESAVGGEQRFERIARKWWNWWAVGKSPRHDRLRLAPALEADVFSAFGHKFIDDVTPAAGGSSDQGLSL